MITHVYHLFTNGHRSFHISKKGGPGIIHCTLAEVVLTLIPPQTVFGTSTTGCRPICKESISAMSEAAIQFYAVASRNEKAQKAMRVSHFAAPLINLLIR